jgi:hypothetical protein
MRRITIVCIITLLLSASTLRAEEHKLHRDLPEAENDALFIVFDPIKRSADGMRITMPVKVINVRRGDVHVTFADASAWDGDGTQCSFELGNGSVAGVANSRERKDATLLQFGAGVNVSVSTACARPSTGRFFMARVEFGLFAGASEPGVRVGAGNLRLPVADPKAD